MNPQSPSRRPNPPLRRLLQQHFPDIPVRKAFELFNLGVLRFDPKMTCGAYARSTGKPCRAKAIPGSWRCKNHGGAPKSEQGRQNIREGQYRRWAKWHEAKQRSMGSDESEGGRPGALRLPCQARHGQ